MNKKRMLRILPTFYHINILLAILLYWTSGAGAKPYEITPPRNTAATNGTTALLQCAIQGYGREVVWKDYLTSSGEAISFNRRLVTSHRFYGSFSIEGWYNLKIQAESKLSGKYACETYDGSTKKYAYLVVLESDTPTCNYGTSNEFLEGETADLVCVVRCSGAYEPSVSWYNPKTNQTVASESFPLDSCSTAIISNFVVDSSFNGIDLTCLVSFGTPEASVMPNDENHDQRNPLFTSSCSKPLNVLYGVKTVHFDRSSTGNVTYPGDTITCVSPGNPSPVFEWERLSGNYNSTLSNTSTITVTSAMVGYNKLRCIATNYVKNVAHTVKGEVEFTVELAVSTSRGGRNVGAIVGGVLGAVLAVLLIVVVVFIILKRRTERANESGSPAIDSEKRQGRLNDYVLQTPIQFFNKHLRRRPDSQASTTNFGGDVPVVSHWEIPRENLHMAKKLGEGSFGQVFRAEAWKLPQIPGTAEVAVKMLKQNASDKDKQDLLMELEVMKNLSPHPNVVSLLGCCTQKDPIMVVVEYLPHGNLKDFLKSKRPKTRAEQEYASLEEVTCDTIESRDLLSYAHQTARGMAHISSHSLLHRDLAARNILVGENGICKVSDFGFARDVIDRNIYHRESQGPLPIRWMAPESIFDNVYTTKSDVWSFGVLLWEIVTMGANPFPGMSGREVMDLIRKGQRMEKPDHCMPELYSIMQSCWQDDPGDRPSFDVLTATLEELLHEETDYLCLDDIEESLYANIEELRGTDEKI